MNYRKKLQDVGIDSCDNPSQVGIRLHPKSIKMWFGIVAILISTILGGAKLWDGFW